MGLGNYIIEEDDPLYKASEITTQMQKMLEASVSDMETFKKKLEQNDPVEHPSHYTSGSIETIDYINETLGDEGLVYFYWGNALKYLSRAKLKNNCREDLLKACWYMNKIKEKLNDNEEVLK